MGYETLTVTSFSAVGTFVSADVFKYIANIRRQHPHVYCAVAEWGADEEEYCTVPRKYFLYIPDTMSSAFHREVFTDVGEVLYDEYPESSTYHEHMNPFFAREIAMVSALLQSQFCNAAHWLLDGYYNLHGTSSQLLQPREPRVRAQKVT